MYNYASNLKANARDKCIVRKISVVHKLSMILDKCIPSLPKEHPKANLNDAQVALSRQYS